MSNNYYVSPADLAPSTKARAGDINTIDQSVDAAFDKLPTELALKTGTVNFAVNTSVVANAYAVTLPLPASVLAYPDGLEVKMRPVTDNTAAATLNVNGLGNIAIKRQDGTDALPGDLVGASNMTLIYSAASNSFRMPPLANGQVKQAADSAAAAAASAASASGSATAANTSRINAGTSEANALSYAASALASKNAAATSEANMASKAPLASPALTGRVTVNMADNGVDALQVNGSATILSDLKVNAGNDVGFTLNGGLAMQRKSGNDLGFLTNSLERMRISNGGNLLIGATTDNGTDKLQVAGSITSRNNIGITTNGAAGSNASPIYTQLAFRGYQNNRLAAIRSFDQTGSYASGGGLEFLVNSNLGADTMLSAMTVGANGRVSIGVTDNGTDKLQVGGNINSSSFTVNNSVATAGIQEIGRITHTSYSPGQQIGTALKMGFAQDGYGARIVAVGDPTGANAYSLAFERGAGGTSYLESMRIGQTGNLLVGGTNNAARSARILSENGNDTPQLALRYTGIATWHHSVTSSGAYAFDKDGAEKMRLDPSGNLLVGTTAGSSHTLYRAGGEATQILDVFTASAFYVGLGNGFNGAACAQVLTKNTSTGRSLNAAGTINASGADYAEYMRKADNCGDIAKGAVVGVNIHGELTDKWADAVSFMVKTTNPSYVGGDTWGSDEALGVARPQEPHDNPPAYAGSADPGQAPELNAVLPAAPATPPGNADDAMVAEFKAASAQYRAGLASFTSAYLTYSAAIAAHQVATANYQRDQAAYLAAIANARAAAMAAYEVDLAHFNTVLEAARAKVDRIAFAGQVPVNVQGAQPGMFIVPIQVGAGIGGQALAKGALTLAQYMAAVGVVQNILADGRANIRVKVA